MTHTPRPIEDNPIHRDLATAAEGFRDVYSGRSVALILTGPTGIGKSYTAEHIAKEHGKKWHSNRPGSFAGMMQILHRNRFQPVIGFDDIDWLWKDPKLVDMLRPAFESRAKRVLSHTVVGKQEFKPFQLKACAIFLSNLDFNNPRNFGGEKSAMWTAVEAVKNRASVRHLSFDPLDCYEYTGWLATTGGMLRNIVINLEPGTKLVKRGEVVEVTERTRQQRLNADEANDVLEHFANNAARYSHPTPRYLERIAKNRIGKDRAIWEAGCEQELLPEPKWQLPDDLYQYRIEPKAKPTVTVNKPAEVKSAKPTKPKITKAKVKPAKVKSAPKKTPHRLKVSQGIEVWVAGYVASGGKTHCVACKREVKANQTGVIRYHKVLKDDLKMVACDGRGRPPLEWQNRQQELSEGKA